MTRRPLLLAIDDDRGWLEILRMALGGRYDVLLCVEPQAALDLAKSQRPDVVLFDLGLPNVDSHVLLCQLCEVMPHSVIAIMTACQRVESAVHCLRAGAVDYLTKDMGKNLLLSRIADLVAIACGRPSQDPDTDRVVRALAGCVRLPSSRVLHDELIEVALRRHGGNCSAAARELGLTPQAVSAYVRRRAITG